MLEGRVLEGGWDGDVVGFEMQEEAGSESHPKCLSLSHRRRHNHNERRVGCSD